MGDYGGAKGRGQGRGRGRGGRGGGQTQAIKNLERAAADIQDMLHKLKTSDNQDAGEGRAANKKKGTRGSQSLMDLSFQGSAQRGGPHNQNPGYQDFHHQRPSSQNSYHQGPDQNSYYAHPPNQGPHYQGPPGQGPHYQSPPGQVPHYQVPPGQGPHYQGPPGQGPYFQGPPNQRPYPGGQYNEGHNYYPPPPSYEESMSQDGKRLQSTLVQNKFKGGGKPSQRVPSKPVSAQELVKALAMFEGQMADTEMISRQIESSAEEVEKIVQQRKDIFAYMKDGPKVVVELVPNIKLCSYYLSESGCTARDTCQSLHVCKTFILARCDQGSSCPYGHRLDTNHNTSVLSKLYLDLIKTHNLLSVIRKVCRGNAPPKICSFYNTRDGCKKSDNCRFLHICKNYVTNDGKCSAKDCSFNHQLTYKQCKNVLTQHGVSTNESIRDILLKLRASLENTTLTKNKEERENIDSSDSSDSDTSQDPSETSVKKKRRSKSRDNTKGKDSKSGGKAKGKSSTIKSTDFYGNVESPEICIYAVNGKCLNEKKGCKYLHAKSLFHWQVEKDKIWYNFRIFQSKTLESAYREVSKNGVRLPSIDADRLSSEDKKILQILGPNMWTADFKEMHIEDPATNKLNIRRVSTPSSVVSSLPQATVYEWYFADEQGKWIRYGHVDSLGKQDLVCNITSEDIEKQYITDSSIPLIISNNHFKYRIDFTNMTQTNMSSQKVREIRRRPSRLSYQKGSSTTTTSSDASLPSHWQPMTPQQTHALVTLDSSQPEFQEVSKSIKLMIPTAKICEIRRLQNEYLWRLFQLKKADLSTRYDELTMNVQKLYHGTGSDYISAICKENIDGRRYVNTKDKYGKGTYFSNSSAIARTHCTPDAQGHVFIILAEVIIGYVVGGSKSMNKPPLNTQTGHDYDTSVDNMTAPTIFVKYDKEEYYPEYIIEIST